MKNSTLIAIPGFLGLPSDWDFLDSMFLLKKIDLSQIRFQTLIEWGKTFNEHQFQNCQSSKILMGYSLGGRLALHTLIDQPHQWKAAIIISSHPGLTTNTEQQQRVINDQKWARHFQIMEWNALMSLWNKQSSFGHLPVPWIREESHYNRLILSHYLTKASLGKQKNLRDSISRLSCPLLWITGEKDIRFTQAAQDLQFAHPLSKKIALPHAYHRLPWTHQNEFISLIQDFINQVEN